MAEGLVHAEGGVTARLDEAARRDHADGVRVVLHDGDAPRDVAHVGHVAHAAHEDRARLPLELELERERVLAGEGDVVRSHVADERLVRVVEAEGEGDVEPAVVELHVERVAHGLDRERLEARQRDRAGLAVDADAHHERERVALVVGARRDPGQRGLHDVRRRLADEPARAGGAEEPGRRELAPGEALAVPEGEGDEPAEDRGRDRLPATPPAPPVGAHDAARSAPIAPARGPSRRAVLRSPSVARWTRSAGSPPS